MRKKSKRKPHFIPYAKSPTKTEKEEENEKEKAKKKKTKKRPSAKVLSTFSKVAGFGAAPQGLKPPSRRESPLTAPAPKCYNDPNSDKKGAAKHDLPT
ncbi:hypothetical protein [Acutalibacter caecimuris]|uniref:hypothetical protein n=1 Tax=Acutalibacter caecimuris TaxID=3093657 RepID=UPI002AC9279E|nr:hypothetical protein [Acutalibacter sp. M00118]